MNRKRINGMGAGGLRPFCRDENLDDVFNSQSRAFPVMNLDDPITATLARFPVLPDDAVVKQPVVQALYPVSDFQLWKLVRAGRFPAPEKIGARSIGWRVGPLREFLARERPPANLGVNPVASRQEGADGTL
jgi:predicted DNA-binding transcriptional regulator AlpA